VLKKYLSISLVLLAYSIMLLHDFLPHVHIEAIDHYAQHDNYHQDDDNDDHGFLNHAFAHFQHDKGVGITTISCEKNEVDATQSAVKELIPFVAVFLLKLEVEPPSNHLSPGRSLSLYSYLFSSSNSRRGPPAFIV
jgi:hypothetical protein